MVQACGWSLQLHPDPGADSISTCLGAQAGYLDGIILSRHSPASLLSTLTGKGEEEEGMTSLWFFRSWWQSQQNENLSFQRFFPPFQWLVLQAKSTSEPCRVGGSFVIRTHLGAHS